MRTTLSLQGTRGEIVPTGQFLTNLNLFEFIPFNPLILISEISHFFELTILIRFVIVYFFERLAFPGFLEHS